MATVTKSSDTVDKFGDHAVIFTWTPLTETNNDGEAVEMPGSADRSVQAYGTWGTGGNLLWEGTNEADPATASNWATLNDPASSPLTGGADALSGVLELTRWIRPRVSAGTGVSVTAHLLVKRK